MSQKKNVLIFIDWFLPGYKAGGPIRSMANLVDHLSNDFDFYIVTRDTDYFDATPYREITSNSWVRHSSGAMVYYFSKDQLNARNLKKVIESLQFDIAYINGVYSFFFSILPLYFLREKRDAETIVAPRGMLKASAIGVKRWKKRLFLSVSKWIGLYKNVKFHATNEEELLEVCKEINKNAEVRIAPNLPRKVKKESMRKEVKKDGSVKMISIARIAPEKNTLYAFQILQQIKDHDKIDFHIYGPVYNQSYWKECEVVKNQLPPHISVDYRGSLETEKIYETLTQYDFLFFPTRGENFGHIILESLSAGCPVIISDQTPWRDLQTKKLGWDLPLHSPEEFVKAIDEACSFDETRYREWSEACVEYARGIVNDPAVLEMNRKLFQ